MRCPRLSELPPPPPEKIGWPWTEESPELPNRMQDGRSWPRISIITTSFNQGNYIEETIRSVLLQGYPDLEYFLIDGGSTDQSVEIIQKYAPWLAYWVSESDRGQSHALNKGFARSSGNLLGWINSDDFLLPGAIHQLALLYAQDPGAVLLGNVILFSEPGDFVQEWDQVNVTFERMVQNWKIGLRWSQPGTYFSREHYSRVGPFDESLRYEFDREWMCRLLQIAPVHYLHEPVARFRMHPSSKTVSEAPDWLPEQVLVTERYSNQIAGFDSGLARAEQELWFGALPHLSLVRHKFNRLKGLIHLREALKYDWRVFFSLQFALLLLVALTPLGILRLARRFVKL